MANTTTIAEFELNNTTDLDYLLGSLRVQLGDIISPFIYSDGVLRRTLIDAFNSLDVRWQFRYILDSNFIVSRNLNGVFKFSTNEPSTPVILKYDERPIILQAAILLRSSNLTNLSLSGSLGSWRDDEISVSNISSINAIQALIDRDQRELDSILPPRDMKLARPSKQSLLGFNEPANYFEGSK